MRRDMSMGRHGMGRHGRSARGALQPEETSGRSDRIKGFFAGRVPDSWFVGSPDITIDNDEILVVGRLEVPEASEDLSEQARPAAEASRMASFREETREQRMAIAADAEREFRQKVSWGAECGGSRRLFTTASVPFMTRLRIDERQVLDTLVAAGVARSRSDALAWCVRLVGRHEQDWLTDLREALVHVDKVRSEGPVTI
jgi:hypothetical protein